MHRHGVGLLPVEQRVFVLRSIRGAVVVWVMDGEDHLNVCDGVEHVVSEANDGLFRFIVCGVLGYQLTVGLQAPHNALGVHVVSWRASVRPLLQSWLAWRELSAAHCAGSALALSGSLGSDCPFAASATDASSWCGDVMRVGTWCGWVRLHVDIIGAADRVSQLSYIDDVSHFACPQFVGTEQVTQ